MRRYNTLVRATLLSLVLVALWFVWILPKFDLLANFDFSQFYVGEVNTELVFRSRFHTFVIDDTESCYIPAWLPTHNTSGTLLTIKEGCEVPEGWNAYSHKKSTPLIMALWLCSQGDKMLCLLIHNSGSTPFGEIKAMQSGLNPLNPLTKQTLAPHSNEDCAWRCNDNFVQSCLVVPGIQSFCLMEKVRDEKLQSKINKNWPDYVEQCGLHNQKLDWYSLGEEVFVPPESE
ncbi:hypothetical protein CJU89_6955 [Yarrowia sp. B02]|nr:hypothetical protein CJU89_6955 [Yarrowia sp. B02]